MPDPKDTLNNLASSKDQLAQASKIAEGVKSGALPAADAFKIPEQVAAAKGMLADLGAGIPGLDAAQDAMDGAFSAAGALKDELAQKLPEPVMTSQNALKVLGQEVNAAGEPLKAIAASLPQMKAPLGEASGDLNKLKKKAPSAAKVKATVPDVQAKIKPPKEQIPKVAAQLDPPKAVIEGLSGKLKDVLGGVKPLLDVPPLAKALEKAGTAAKVKEELAAAEEKLPRIPPLIDAAKAKINEALAPLLDADKKLAELQAAAVAIAPPPPDAALEGLQQQIQNTAAAVTQAAVPVNAAAVNLPAALQKVEQAQALSAKASDQMTPPELKQTMDQVVQLIGEAQKEIGAPAAGMQDTLDAAGPTVEALSAVTEAAAATLPAAAMAAPEGQQAKAAELFDHAQNALQPGPEQMAAAIPTVQQLQEKLPEIMAPLAQALQAMHDALTPAQQDLAEIERQLLQAEDQMTVQTQQVDVVVKQIDESRTKVDGIAAVSDVVELKKALDDIVTGLPQLDDQPIADLEKKIPELEALLERVEKSDGGAA